MACALGASQPRAHEVELRSPSPPRPPVEPAPSPAPDRFELVAHSQTYLQLFRRALLPGPGGALVSTETALPLTQYLLIRAADVDSPWHQDSVDLELSAWGQLWPTSSDYERPFDGDLQTASLRYRAGPAWLKLGRQLAVGGAARFSRFDGVAVGGALPVGLFASAYGGAAVLPRWDARPGYHQLGSAERDLLRDPELQLERSAHWLAGAKLGYQRGQLAGSVSFHEQREQGGLKRRNLGADLTGRVSPRLALGTSALLELDSRSLADLRLWLDAEPHPLVRAGLEALRAEPALFLSRQSVLSVFDSGGYDELGGSASVQARSWLRLDAGGYLQRYDEGRPGARGEAAARFAVDRYYATFVRVAYARVLVPRNGYHALRASLGRSLTRKLSSTLELYGYFYDARVLGYRASSVYSGTLSYQALEALALLWGASLSRSPYARLDAQTLLRLSYELDARPREARR